MKSLKITLKKEVRKRSLHPITKNVHTIFEKKLYGKAALTFLIGEFVCYKK